MRKTIVLAIVFMVCLVFGSGAVAQPNKFWAMDVGNTWNRSGSNPIGCGGPPPCTWTWRTTVGAIDSVSFPGFTTFRFDGFDAGIFLDQREWYSVSAVDPFELRQHRLDDLVDNISVFIDGGLLMGFKPIVVGIPFSQGPTPGTFFNGVATIPINASSTTTVVGFGPVTVPLGTFQAYQVHREVTVPEIGGIVINQDRWFAPYIGVVREVEFIGPGDVDTEVLTSLNIATVFNDVPVMSGPTVNIFYQYIMGIYDEGITVGTGPGTYSPLMNVTREQMAAFLVRAKMGGQFFEGPCTGPSPFSDVPQSSNFCRNIEQLVTLGITRGCGDGTTYCPSATVNREQMAAFIVRAVMDGQFFEGPCTPPNLSPFPDVPSSSNFCRNIAQLVNLGITRGCGTGTTYCPADNVLRDQMAAFLARAFLGMP